jgi:hypothetical protein
MLEDGHGRLEPVKFHAPPTRAATGTRRRTTTSLATGSTVTVADEPAVHGCRMIRLRDLRGMSEDSGHWSGGRTWRFAALYVTEPRPEVACGMGA